MKPVGIVFLFAVLLIQQQLSAQGGPRPSELGTSDLNPGEPGIAWYTTWESALAEAKRSGRPIIFVAAATQCHGVSGVF